MKLLKAMEITYDTKSLAESFNWRIGSTSTKKSWSNWMRDFATYVLEKANEQEEYENKED